MEILDIIARVRAECDKAGAARIQIGDALAMCYAVEETANTVTALRGHLASSRERVTQLMATSDKERAICKDALDTYGVSAQLQVAMEECGELVVAISHYLRGRDNALEALAEEIADVEVMCVQLREVVGESWDVDAIKAAKWERLRARLDARLSKKVEHV